MDWKGRIAIDPALLVGKPVIRGTRLAVDFIVGLLADGMSVEDVVREYPGVVPEDVRACLAYAAAALSSERVYPLGAA